MAKREKTEQRNGQDTITGGRRTNPLVSNSTERRPIYGGASLARLCAAAALFLLCAPAPRAAVITWSSPQSIGTFPCIVKTEGTLVEAFAADNGNRIPGMAVPNGVNFIYTNDMLSSSNLPGALGIFIHPDPDMDDLLFRLDFGSTAANPASISVGEGLSAQVPSLIVGTNYLIQVFNTDLRSCCDNRMVEFGDGEPSPSTVILHTTGPGTIGVDAWGETVIGRFTANATTQTLTVEALTGITPQFNAYQLRVANDFDGDLVFDAEDNCLLAPNPGQDDTDEDNFGNKCDADYDQSGIPDGGDFGTFAFAFGTSSEEQCHTGTIPGCTVDGADFGFFAFAFGSGPGPSGTKCP